MDKKEAYQKPELTYQPLVFDDVRMSGMIVQPGGDGDIHQW